MLNMIYKFTNTIENMIYKFTNTIKSIVKKLDILISDTLIDDIHFDSYRRIVSKLDLFLAI